MIKGLREAFQLGPLVLNNLSPLDAIRTIDEKLASYEYPETESPQKIPRSLKDLSQSFEESLALNPGFAYSALGEKSLHPSKINQVSTFFVLLDLFGHWGDNQRTYEKETRYNDASHALVGSYFDIIVSSDKRFLKKSDAVFKYLDIDTRTFYLVDFKKHLEENLR